MRRILCSFLIVTVVIAIGLLIYGLTTWERTKDKQPNDIATRLQFDNVARGHFNTGNQLLSSGSFLEAIESYDQCINIEPDSYSLRHYIRLAYHNRGMAKQKLEMYALAIEDYTEAIKRGYHHPDAYYNRGTARLLSNPSDHYPSMLEERWDQDYPYKHESSLADFYQAIKLNSDHAPSYFNIGIIYKSQAGSNYYFAKERQRKALLAIKNFNEAIRADPQYILAYMQLGEIKREIGLLVPAKRDFLKALSLAKQVNDITAQMAAEQAIKSLY